MKRYKLLSFILIGALLVFNPLSAAAQTEGPQTSYEQDWDGSAQPEVPAAPQQADGYDPAGFAVAQAAAGPAASCGQAPAAWEPIAPLNHARSRTGMVYFAGAKAFYLVGGEGISGNRALPIEMYDPVANTWTDRAQLGTGVSNTGAAVVGNYIYIPGGYNGSAAITTMQRYDPFADTVSTVAAMPVANQAHAVVAVGTKIYVMGGSPSATAGATNYIYNTATNTWSNGKPVPTSVMFPSAATDGSLIYLVGGRASDDLKVLQIYNPATDNWVTGPTLATARAGAGVFYDGQRLWAVGGGWTTFHSSTEYLQAGSWSSGPALNLGARTVGAAFGGNMAVKAGGYMYDYVARAERLVIPPPCTPGVDLSVTMSAAPNPVMKGGLSTLTVTVTNHGDQPAADVEITANMAAGVLVGKVLCSSGYCVASTNTEAYAFISSLSSGSSVTVTVLVSPTTTACISTAPISVKVRTSSGDYFYANDFIHSRLAVRCTQACVTALSTDVPKAIPDGVSGGVRSTLFLPNTLPIYDLDIVGLSITDPHDGDLNAVLWSPNAVPVTVLTNVGGSGANFTETSLDDHAILPIYSGAAPFTGAFQPANPLSAYNSVSSKGDWALTVNDTVADSVSGTLTAWGLRICSAPQEPAPYSADDSLTITANQYHLMANGTVEYKMTVANDGPQINTNVKLEATLPEQWSFLDGRLGQGSCTYIYLDRKLNCNFGNVAPGYSAYVTLVGKISATAACPSKMSFWAGTSADLFDPDITNNTIQSNVNLVCAPPVFLPILTR